MKIFSLLMGLVLTAVFIVHVFTFGDARDADDIEGMISSAFFALIALFCAESAYRDSRD